MAASLTHDIRIRAIVALIAVAGAAIIIYATSFGIGADVDSATYVMAARSFIAGKGLVLQTAGNNQPVPLTSFPPLLPLMLSVARLFRVDPLIPARWLNAVLFGADIFLFGLIVKKYTESNKATIFSVLLLVTTEDFVANHCLLISEPLFLVCALAGLLLMICYIGNPTLTSLLGFSLAFAAACGTRYIGVILLPIGAGVAAYVPAEARLRKLHFSSFLAVFIFPALIWAARNITRAHTITNHPLGFHPPPIDRFVRSGLSLTTWVLPAAVPEFLRIILLMLAAVLIGRPIWLRFTKRPRSPGRSRVHFLLIAILCAYVLGFFVAQTFFDSQLWISGRHLLFLYLISVPLVISQAKEIANTLGSKARVASLCLCLPILGLGAFRTIKNARRTHQEGLGLTSKRWETSGLIERLRKLDPGVPIISNSKATVYLLAGTVAYPLTSRFSRSLDKLMDAGGCVVYFTAFQSPSSVLRREKELEANFELQRIAVTPEGYLLAKRPSDCLDPHGL